MKLFPIKNLPQFINNLYSEDYFSKSSYNFPQSEWATLSKKLIKDSSSLEKKEGFLNSISNYIKKVTD